MDRTWFNVPYHGRVGRALRATLTLAIAAGAPVAMALQFQNMRCLTQPQSCGAASQICDPGSSSCTACDGTTSVNSACVHSSGSCCNPSGTVTCGKQFIGFCNVSGTCISTTETQDDCPLASPCNTCPQ